MDLVPEQAGDAEAVLAVHRQAFPTADNVVGLVVDLRERFLPDHGLSLVAREAGEIVGHVLFTEALLDAPKRLLPVQVLSPLGVLPARQRRGVGSALVRRGLEILAERGVPMVFLEGAPSYYPRFGFLPGGEHGFRKPSLRIPDPAFQVALLPGFEPWMSGTLVYPETFWQHDAVGLRDPYA